VSFVSIAISFGVSSAWAAELVMFRRAGCPYCQTWDRVIGSVYPKTDLGRQFPLRMVDLDRDPPMQAKLARTVRFTPTFVLVEDGREIGRIEGYPGEEFFWGLLEKLGRSLPSPS
jgi:thioredoxin-related protein